MGNQHKGDICFNVGGKPYTFRLGMQALAVLEARTGVPAIKFFRRGEEEWSARDLLNVFAAGLSRHHGELSEQEIGDILDDITPAEAGELIGRALTVANGKGAANGAVNPPKSKRGIGTT